MSGRTLTIPNAFSVDSFPASVVVTVNNVLNPSPALTTDEFSATVGNDYSVNGLSNLGSVTLTSAKFLGCSITFSPGNVNRTGNMVFSLTPRNTIPSTGTIELVFPVAGYWALDLATTNQTFKLGSITCTNQSTVLSSLFRMCFQTWDAPDTSEINQFNCLDYSQPILLQHLASQSED